jgi:hypothetical protein
LAWAIIHFRLCCVPFNQDLINEKSVRLAKSIIASLTSTTDTETDASAFASTLIAALHDPPTVEPGAFTAQLRSINDQIGGKPRQNWGQKWRLAIRDFFTWLAKSREAGATSDR